MLEDVGPEAPDDPVEMNDQRGDTPTTPGLKKRGGVGRGMAQDDAALDLILFSREKKWSLVIPSARGLSTCAAGSAVNAANRLRVVQIDGATAIKEGAPEEPNWEHLVGEVNGTRYRVGLAARPELEYHLVGVGAKSLVKKEEDEEEEEEENTRKGKVKKGKKRKGGKAAAAGKGASSKKPLTAKEKKKAREEAASEAAAAAAAKLEADKPKDLTDGNGIEVLFDAVKHTYIISDDVEDKLILLFRNDPVAALKVHACYLKYFDLQINTMDNLRSRLWRRYVRFHLQHKVWDESRYESIRKRYEEVREQMQKANQLLDVTQLDASDTDSDEEKTEAEVSLPSEPSKEKKSKGKGKSKGKLAKGRMDDESSDEDNEAPPPRPASRK